MRTGCFTLCIHHARPTSVLFDPVRLAPLPTCIEGPKAIVSKAQYALVELLRPLGLRPAWTDRDGLSGGGIYYGEHPEAVPRRALRLRHHAGTAAFFARRAPYPTERATTVSWDGEAWPVLFPLDGEGLSSEPFEGSDLVASAFVWLSGWHEATTPDRDAHGRATYASSLQAALDAASPRRDGGLLVDQPIVDAYREMLAAELADQGVAFQRLHWGPGQAGAVSLTFDIDHWRRRRLGVAWRMVRGAAPRSWRALGGPDPFQRGLDLLLAPVEAGGGHATVFLKMAADAAEDVPYRARRAGLERFVRRVQEGGGEVGLHPGYFAHDHAARLLAERDTLAALAGHPIHAVRQHYLRHDAVRTARLHVAAGFTVDSTLGFAQREGFRRATTFPFRLYDLDLDTALDLWAAPVHAMDTTLFQHRRLSDEDVRASFERVVAQARRYGGLAVVLWHNTIGDTHLHPNRAAVYAAMLDDLPGDMPLVTLSEALATWR